VKRQKVPWDAGKAVLRQIVFSQMANWLSFEEPGQLRFKFTQEFERRGNSA
jgi:hypothetical protein